jgi:hypothetical protein
LIFQEIRKRTIPITGTRNNPPAPLDAEAEADAPYLVAEPVAAVVLRVGTDVVVVAEVAIVEVGAATGAGVITTTLVTATVDVCFARAATAHLYGFPFVQH